MTVAVQKIKKYLADNERSQVWLSRQLGISKQYVNSILARGMMPGAKVRKKLKELCGVGDDWV